MKFSDLVKRVSGEGADAWAIHYAAREAQERGEDVIVLSVGDPDLDTPPPVLDRAIEALRARDIRYTPAAGRWPLRAAIAAAHSARCGRQVGASNVIFLSGAQNALFAAALCLAGPGDEVMAFEPLYPSYPATIQASGARLVRIAADPANGFRIDMKRLEEAITARTRALFFASPNNPSGVIFSESDLSGIAALARRHSFWVVADEVYASLAPQGRVPSLAAQIPDQLVTISSLSKSHSMPGWRAGWLVGPEQMVKHVESLAMCMLYGLPGFIQEAALTAIGVADAAEARIRALCNARREALLQGLAGVRGISCVAPDAGMFSLIDVRGTGMSGYDFMCGLFAQEKVSVLDGAVFGEATRGFVRLCFATEEASLHEATARIRRYVGMLMAEGGRHRA